VLRRAGHESVGARRDVRYHLRRRQSLERADGFDQALFSPFLVVTIHRLADAVGERHQDVPGFERDARIGPLAVVNQPDHRSVGFQTDHIASLAPEHKRRVVLSEGEVRSDKGSSVNLAHRDAFNADYPLLTPLFWLSTLA